MYNILHMSSRLVTLVFLLMKCTFQLFWFNCHRTLVYVKFEMNRKLSFAS